MQGTEPDGYRRGSTVGGLRESLVQPGGIAPRKNREGFSEEVLLAAGERF